MITQQEVRAKLIKRSEREKQTYIAKVVGIPKQTLSAFKMGKKDLWQHHLELLNKYLDGEL